MALAAEGTRVAMKNFQTYPKASTNNRGETFALCNCRGLWLLLVREDERGERKEK
jgi:hypothetical protein